MEELLAKYFAGEASEDEKRSVEEWRSSNAKNASAFLAYKTSWLESSPVPPAQDGLLDEIISTSEPTLKVVPLWDQKLFRIAAILILAMGLIFILLNRSSEQPYGQVLEENTAFNLPDGSEVVVYRGGVLSLGSFENQREVMLTGKAYFQVDRDENLPFIVKTKGALVQVLGTSFVVRSSAEERITEVLVENGRVAMSFNPEAFKGKTMKVELENGQMGELEIGKEGIRKRKIIDTNYLAWKTGILNFKREYLLNVAKTIEDVYGVEVRFENPLLQSCRLTAVLKEKSLDEVLTIISETFNISHTREDRVITISGESCS